MNKRTCCVLLGASVVSMPAFSQSSVTLYGVVDTGVEFITHASPKGGTITRMPVIGGADLPSRWGLRGAEDLGDGLKAIFTLENGFSVSNGTLQQGGRLFGRQAFVGLSGSWGALTFGRQYSMTSWGMAESNILGASGLGGLASFDPYLLAARFDNSVVYRGTFAGFTFGAQYSLGRDATPAGNCPGQSGSDFLACRALSAMIKYDGNSWGVAGTYDEQRGGAGAASITVVPGAPGIAFQHSGDTDRRYQIAAYAYVWGARLGAGWLHRQVIGDIQSVKTDLTYLGVSVPLGRWTVDTQISHINDSDFAANGTLAAIRANYNLSKNTSVYGMVGYMQNSGKGAIYSVSATSIVPAAPAPGINQTGMMLGMRHNF